MKKEINIKLIPRTASNKELYKKEIAKKLKIAVENIVEIEVLKRSIDARKKSVQILMRANVWYDGEKPEKKEIEFKPKNVEHKDAVVIVGSGPAGLFAALKLIEQGLKPIILERGNAVTERKRDVANLNRNETINPESNYCFGEGGAGTFSDGKLYTRSKKRGDTKYVLDILKLHGAEQNILTDAHPHIGTNNLPRIIVAIRETILKSGGEVHFNTKVTDFIIKDNEIKGVITEKGDSILGKSVILSTGHSARDIYYLLDKKEIKIEAKPFAMGVRIEHPQSLIDSAQYTCKVRNEFLPAASYNLVSQVRGRGVYSFCMCPGGFIVPAVTGENEIVVNGMSPSKRDSLYANSGIVVEIKPQDFHDKKEHGELAGLKYQEYLENHAYKRGGGGLIAPAQRVTDFIHSKHSSSLPKTSYQPGLVSSPLHQWLPNDISRRLQSALISFDTKLHGFNTNEAIILGVESRTSSPVRIPRDKESLQHVQIKNLYPCGEGAGYAGGIVSAAIDGIRCAEKI